MKKAIKYFLYSLDSVLGAIILIVVIIFLWLTIAGNYNARKNIALAGTIVKSLVKDGIAFRDLNKNGKLDIHEDFRQPREARVNDLLSQMSLEEKAGMMFITQISIGKDGTIMEKPSGKIPRPSPSELALNDQVMELLWRDSAVLAGLSD